MNKESYFTCKLCGRVYKIRYNDKNVEAAKPYMCKCGNSPALVPISAKVGFAFRE